MNAEPTFDFQTYLAVFRRRKWLLLLPLVLMTGIVGAGSLLIPNVYLAASQVVVRQEQDPIKGLAVETQITQQLGGVIQALTSPMEQKEIWEDLSSSRPVGWSVEAGLRDFQQNLRIQQRKADRDLIVDIAYKGNPEAWCVAVVNAFAEEFQRRGAALVSTSLTVSLDFVEEQIIDYRDQLAKVDSAEREVEERLRADLGDLAPLSAAQGLSAFVATRLAEGEGESRRLAMELASLDAQRKYLTAQLASTAPTIELRAEQRSDQTEAQLQRLLAESQMERVRLAMRFTETHPDLVALDRAIEDLSRQLAAFRSERSDERRDLPNPAYENLERELTRVTTSYEAMQAQAETVDERNRRLRGVAPRLPLLEADLKRVQSERQALTATYEQLLARRQSLELNQSFEEGRNTGRFEVRRAGGLELDPIGPNRQKFLVLGFLGGLFIGISFMLLAEYLDHSVRSSEDLKRYVDAPLLAVLPRAPR